MRLTIVIPALNEEAAIGTTIERTLSARAHIINNSPVEQVHITVVSDGSTDRTADIAGRYRGKIDLIVFERNRGYGAAIMEGWKNSDSELLGFLDADGTCDPHVFADLCQALCATDADILLGCRLNASSKMPRLRRAGNLLFAWLLTALSASRVRDAASGMRVVRASCLPKLYPLPHGLHFTPAMSARAILSPDLTIREIDMPYHEREGESKLHPLKDGLRFLSVIVRTAMLYRPSRLMGLLVVVLLMICVGMMAYPTWFWLHFGRVEEWMIYRFLSSELLGTIAVLVWTVSYLGTKAANISLATEPMNHKYTGRAGALFNWPWFWVLPTVLIISGVSLVGEALRDFVITGEVHEHWSRFVAMGFLFLVASILVVTRILDFSLNLLADQLQFDLESARDRGSKPIVGKKAIANGRAHG